MDQPQIPLVDLICVKDRRKLRVRILTNGYLTNANCQFPRDLRVEGRRFRVPASEIKLITTRGKFFYSIKHGIEIVDADTPIQHHSLQHHYSLKIYEDTSNDECVVCLCNPKQMVFNPCGHYYVCGECAMKLTKCPMCRIAIQARISKEELLGDE
jgi:hypothetical protein